MSPKAGVLAGDRERTGCEGRVQYVLQEAAPKAHRGDLDVTAQQLVDVHPKDNI